ncbi:MAG: asparaginase domain-containing protein [Patescibacteria group bacterium]
MKNEEGRDQVYVICTGGTIDKEYERIGGVLNIGRPAVVRAFGAAGVRTKSPPLEALKKDSLEITDDERLLVANVVAAAPTDRVLVTHGTDTMSETAALIDSLGCDKTVVLTGSMVPRDFPGSDADFNLGFAYAAAQMLPPGVYIAMHGKALPHSQYKKDRSIGRFEEK